jgi:hypothetical protein
VDAGEAVGGIAERELFDRHTDDHASDALIGGGRRDVLRHSSGGRRTHPSSAGRIVREEIRFRSSERTFDPEPDIFAGPRSITSTAAGGLKLSSSNPYVCFIVVATTALAIFAGSFACAAISCATDVGTPGTSIVSGDAAKTLTPAPESADENATVDIADRFVSPRLSQ